MSKNEHAGQPNSENPLTQKDRFRLIRQVNEAFDQRIPTTIVGNNTQYDIDYAKRAVESLRKTKVLLVLKMQFFHLKYLPTLLKNINTY
jgi:dihydrodipicolinate synthase/N-acetylneuraminate lyase